MAQRKGCLIGCGVALVVGVALLAALFVGFGKIMDVADRTLVDPAVYEAVRVGDEEGAVRDRLPSGETFMKEGLKEGGPAQPNGSQCSWYISNGESKGGNETVFRFCFTDGKLAEKAEYPLK
ncbi:hypothetical protein ACFWUQ_16715 [Streptomyces sp. NPDC058662]|uniref:hypothetical protein n=1 Tax=Streptomyces sp. NPDC058662 TaxID=3346583 RepID=UPI003668DDF3